MEALSQFVAGRLPAVGMLPSAGLLPNGALNPEELHRAGLPYLLLLVCAANDGCLGDTELKLVGWPCRCFGSPRGTPAGLQRRSLWLAAARGLGRCRGLPFCSVPAAAVVLPTACADPQWRNALPSQLPAHGPAVACTGQARGCTGQRRGRGSHHDLVSTGPAGPPAPRTACCAGAPGTGGSRNALLGRHPQQSGPAANRNPLCRRSALGNQRAGGLVSGSRWPDRRARLTCATASGRHSKPLRASSTASRPA